MCAEQTRKPLPYMAVQVQQAGRPTCQQRRAAGSSKGPLASSPFSRRRCRCLPEAGGAAEGGCHRPSINLLVTSVSKLGRLASRTETLACLFDGGPCAPRHWRRLGQLRGHRWCADAMGEGPMAGLMAPAATCCEGLCKRRNLFSPAACSPCSADPRHSQTSPDCIRPASSVEESVTMSNFKSKLESFQNRFKSLLGARAQVGTLGVGLGAADWARGAARSPEGECSFTPLPTSLLRRATTN